MVPTASWRVAAVLTPLQQRIARLVASLPEAEGFALAGAGALVVHGYIDRQTRDLDYFTTPARQTQVQRLGAALERALTAEGVPSQRLRDLPTFVRLVVGREPDRCEVDVAIDYRALPTETTALGPTLARKELAANKVLAIFDRAEPRDFTDLDAVTRVYPLADLVELAERKDTGFDRPRFVEALASFRRFTPADLSVSSDEHRRLTRVVDGWRRQLERTLERDIGHGHDGPEL
jgi:Nucleotidyl transferase AbiEii toxin, Type IV TA system